MDQNSGDGEPNLGGSQQCTSKEKYAMEENCGVAPEKTFGNGVNFTSMDSPSSTANKVSPAGHRCTVLNNASCCLVILYKEFPYFMKIVQLLFFPKLTNIPEYLIVPSSRRLCSI